MLIFLVVLGHLAGGVSHSCTGSAQGALQFIYKWIYLFHMPAFFFVAGITQGLRGSNSSRSLRSFVERKAERLLVPYAVWGVVSVMIYLALQSLTRSLNGDYYSGMTTNVWWQPFVSLLHAGGWPNGEGFRYNSVLWFLPCLFVVNLLDYALTRFEIAREVAGQVGIMLGGFVLGGVLRIYGVGELPWQFNLAPYYLAFVFFGKLVSRCDWSCPRWGLLGLWTLFSLIAFAIPDMGIAWFKWKWFGVQGMMAAAGCVLAYWTARHLEWTWFAKIGVASLGIMLMHKFLVLATQLVFAHWAITSATAGVGLVMMSSIGLTAVTYGATLLVRKVAPWSLGEFEK